MAKAKVKPGGIGEPTGKGHRRTRKMQRPQFWSLRPTVRHRVEKLQYGWCPRGTTIGTTKRTNGNDLACWATSRMVVWGEEKIRGDTCSCQRQGFGSRHTRLVEGKRENDGAATRDVPNTGGHEMSVFGWACKVVGSGREAIIRTKNTTADEAGVEIGSKKGKDMHRRSRLGQTRSEMAR